jgi:ubiquinone/menaquinone biosynthesis C-methylase UbiE
MLSSFSERANALELIDGPLESEAELRRSFRDIALANRWFGGTAAVQRALRGIAPRTILDVATGIADIPAALLRSARAQGNTLQITGLDNNPLLLNYARERYAHDAALAFVESNATVLPFGEGAFDVAMCNLALHHFDPPSAIALLAELRRVARIVPIVTDLQRSPLAYAAVFAFTRLFTLNRLTRHDGPLSARRAYTPDEALTLARKAGWKAPSVRSFGTIRMVLRDEAGI